MSKSRKYTFAISLSVLNHLGRHLYRSFVTILGEAISNSWDADATNVWIFVDKEKNSFVIKDDGTGMSEDDFQNRFLNIGYSKREDKGNKSPCGRPFIGRKGIGKLALLSCAEKITIMSKTKSTDYTGGVIDNPNLDKAIKDDLKPDQYPLGELDQKIFKPFIEGSDKQGTIIYFEGIKGGIKNTLELLKKIIALYFRFSLLDKSFNIFIDKEKITYENLKDLAEKTEFLWNVNGLKDPYIEKQLTNLKEQKALKASQNIQGFVASVSHYRDLNIMNLDEKVGIDLFVNGRLRERDILRHISKARVVEDYLYGQIHFNDLDESSVDRFTSNREGLIPDDVKYQEFLKKLEDEVLRVVISDWDKWRRKHREDGDVENPDISPKVRKSEELFNVVSREYIPSTGSDNEKEIAGWINSLSGDASFNLGSYAECFVSENLLREHIKSNVTTPMTCDNIDLKEKTCEDRYDPERGQISLCACCKGARGIKSLREQKSVAKTSIKIRTNEDDILTYLDYIDLAKIIDDSILKEEDKPYKPLRNSVMHTSRLTEEAKTKLKSVFDNIIATVKKLIK